MADKTTPASQFLTGRIEGAVAHLIIDRPDRRNAINIAMWRAIPQLISSFEESPEVRAIVVRGSGTEAFSAGADISEFEETRATPMASRAYDQLNAAAFAALTASPLPSIALIHGICFGGGLALAAACDLRVASSTATFCIPAAQLGLPYPHESLAHITSLIGPAMTKELLFTARRIDAVTAHSCGLINKLTAPDDLDDAVMKLCQQIAANAPLTVRAAKYTIDQATRHPGQPNLAGIEQHANACFSSTDYAEGRRAFLEKRKPVFTGR